MKKIISVFLLAYFAFLSSNCSHPNNNVYPASDMVKDSSAGPSIVSDIVTDIPVEQSISSDAVVEGYVEQNIAYDTVIDSLTDASVDLSDATLYYGVWEVEEDYGYHGIHRTMMYDIFEVAEHITISSDIFLSTNVEILNPRYVVKKITDYTLLNIYRIYGVQDLGIDLSKEIIEVRILAESNADTEYTYCFFVIDADKIVLEGDVHRYYRVTRYE